MSYVSVRVSFVKRDTKFFIYVLKYRFDSFRLWGLMHMALGLRNFHEIINISCVIIENHIRDSFKSLPLIKPHNNLFYLLVEQNIL